MYAEHLQADQGPPDGNVPAAESGGGDPPAGFVVLSLIAFLVFVGGAYLAGMLVASPRTPGSPGRPAEGVASPAAMAPPESPAAQGGGECLRCDWPGTRCEDGKCRLALDSHWRVRPFAVSRSESNDYTYEVCIRATGVSGWTCSGTSTTAREATPTRFLYYFPAGASVLVVTQAQLEGTGFDVQVRWHDTVISEYTGVRLRSRIVVGELLFKGGLVLSLGDQFVDIVLRVESDE